QPAHRRRRAGELGGAGLGCCRQGLPLLCAKNSGGNWLGALCSRRRLPAHERGSLRKVGGDPPLRRGVGCRRLHSRALRGGLMFNGLIEEVGHVQQVANGHAGTRLKVEAKNLARELKKGDSVAVSGVCLTAVEVEPNGFSADLAQETLERTSLAQLRTGALV